MIDNRIVVSGNQVSGFRAGFGLLRGALILDSGLEGGGEFAPLSVIGIPEGDHVGVEHESGGFVAVAVE